MRICLVVEAVSVYALGWLLGLASNGLVTVVLRRNLSLEFRSDRSTLLPSDMTPSHWFPYDDKFDDSATGAGHAGMWHELVAGRRIT
jgi:hypothetical protein